MKKQASDSFVFEAPIRVSNSHRRELRIRFDFGRNLYNAVLDGALGRLRMMRDSMEYSKAIWMPKELPSGDLNLERKRILNALARKWRLSDYDLQHDALEHRREAKYSNRIDAMTAQKIGTRVWQAISRSLFRKGGHPRFKNRRGFRSLEGKTNSSGIRFDGKYIIWGKMKLPVMLDPKDKHGVQAYALEHPVKYCRLLRREIKGRERYFAQLVLEGKPCQKHATGKGLVGVDIGLGIVAVYAHGDKWAKLTPLAPDIERHQAERRRVQRKMDRSKRASNPDCYNADGTFIKGKKLKNFSKSYEKLRQKYADILRVQTEQRKRSHNALANEILTHGVDVRIEKTSKQGWSKLWGKTVGRRAPGMFETTLLRKARSAGGAVEVFSTFSTCLSSTCVCGKKRKKQLGERMHFCECGAYAQRDLFSAFLATFVENGNLNLCRAGEAWPGAKPLLERAWRECRKSTNGEDALASLGLSLCPGSELMRVKESRHEARPASEDENSVRKVRTRKIESPCRSIQNPLPFRGGHAVTASSDACV